MQYVDSGKIIEMHQGHLDSLQAWISLHNYTYSLCNRKENKVEVRDGYVGKVLCILTEINLLPENDWIVFLDLDVAVCDRDRNLRELMTDPTCHIIAQDHDWTINTGFLMFKNNNFTRDLIQKWYER